MRRFAKRERPEVPETLLECLRRTEQLERPLEVLGSRWRWQLDLEEQREHGPRYSSGAWFGVTEAEPHLQMRYRRALQVLAQAGLVLPYRKWGRRLSHVKLTPRGRAVALRLRVGEHAPRGQLVTDARDE